MFAVIKTGGKQYLVEEGESLKIEKHYGHPQDIEWGMEDKKLYIVQSRPVTTLRQVTGQSKNRTRKEAQFVVALGER